MVIAEEGMPRLEELEEYYGTEKGHDYERVWIRDGLREEREGWTYAWKHSHGYPEIEGGSWRSR